MSNFGYVFFLPIGVFVPSLYIYSSLVSKTSLKALCDSVNVVSSNPFPHNASINSLDNRSTNYLPSISLITFALISSNLKALDA